MYKITVYKDFTVDGKEFTGKFENEDDALDFLESIGYDVDNDNQIDALVNDGGTYNGLNGNEFKIEKLESEKSPEFIAKMFKEFYEENEIDYSNKDAEDLAQDILNSPYGEETGMTEKRAREFAKDVLPLLIENNKTAFNNAELFVEEYKGYLLGKTIYSNGDKVLIKNIYSALPKNNIVKINYLDKNSGEETGVYIEPKVFQNFIDGEEVNNEDLGKIQLILQEEKENNSLNHPEFKYYIINNSNKVLGGFEYNEDAKKAADERQKFGENIVVLSKRDLIDAKINPDEPTNWEINFHDWVIIEKCINAGTDAGEYSPKEATKYIEGFKKDGSYISVIKARLIYCLANAQQKLRGAYIVSNLESINEKCDENCRIQKELKRIIAMEK